MEITFIVALPSRFRVYASGVAINRGMKKDIVKPQVTHFIYDER